MNLSNKSDQELKDIITAVLREQNLRRKLDASPEKIDQAVRQYQVESGVKDGEPWEHPRSSLLRPMEGALRTHDGKLWRSTIDHNVFEPGVSGWKLVPEVDPETGETIYPPFNRPSGAHDAYEAGDRITWTDGEVYEAVRDGVDWDPGNAPEDWVLIVEEEEPPGEEGPTEPEEPEPGDGEGDEDDEPTEPGPEEPDDDEDIPDDGEDETGDEDEDEPDEPELPEWNPDGHQYQAGDTFTYGGAVYVVLQGHTSASHWTPSAVPALYERQD